MASTRRALSMLAGLALVWTGCGGGGGAAGTKDESGSTTNSQSGTDATSDGETTSQDTEGTSGSTATDDATDTTDTGTPTGRLFAYFGGYAGTIQWAELDPETGSPSGEGQIDAGPNPSFLAVNPARTHLYATNETGDFEGNPTGAIAAFEIDAADGSLVFLGRVASGGRGPAHVATDSSGEWVFAANYTEGTAAVFPVLPDGSLGDAVDIEDRGDGAQAHMATPDPDNAHVFVPCKGLDLVAQFEFDAGTGDLAPNGVPDVPTASGAGPRHLEFHPTLSRAYVINELDDTVGVYTYDAGQGRLSPLQVIDSLPDGFDGDQNSGADIHVEQHGQFLYASNRGHDSIVVYSIDPGTGMLTLVEHEPSGGQTPRNFDLVYGTSLALVANQDSDVVVVFVRGGDGRLDPNGVTIAVPSPSFVGSTWFD